MPAEQLIALEAAVGEIGALYGVARRFAALSARAETELLPQLIALGSRLRALLRAQHLDDHEIDAAATTIVAVASEWRAALEQLHTSSLYQRALAAYAANHQADLATVIPEIFAGVRLLHPAPSLYVSFSASSGRRRPGSPPFLSVTECVDRLARLVSDGIAAEASGDDWWERELAPIDCAESADDLDSPLWLSIAAADVPASVFAGEGDSGCHLYTPRLRAPMRVGLAAEATDEWWYAYDGSYATFRDQLRDALKTRAVPMEG